jgi:tetratricopeptide (TPR) repeat protein
LKTTKAKQVLNRLPALKVGLCFWVALSFSVNAQEPKQNLLSTNFTAWYGLLYNLQADLGHPLLSTVKPTEKDLAALNFYWQQLLLEGNQNEAVAAIEKLASHYRIPEEKLGTASPMLLFMAAATKAFEARALAIAEQPLSGARAYRHASLYLVPLRRYAAQYQEVDLLVTLYDACLSELQSDWVYSAFTWFLPKPQNEEAFTHLQQLAKATNTFVSTEALYFNYKILAALKEKPKEALKPLEILINSYPNNILLQLESYKNGGRATTEGQFNLSAKIKSHKQLSTAAQSHLSNILNKMP